ncbi:MAG: BamA/TamA family outer membrane protein [Bacteroidota bacterium]
MAGFVKNITLCVVLLFIFQNASSQSDTSKHIRKPFILRTIDWGYRIIEGDSAHPRKRYILPFPIVVYKPETRWVLGVSVTNIFHASKDSITRPSYVRLNVAYSQEKQFSIRPSIEYFSKDNKINIRGLYNYTNFSENFWGIGKNTPTSNKELYSFRQHKAYLKVAYQARPHLFVGAQYGMENLYHVNKVSGGLLETSNLNGSNGYFVSGLGATIYYDNRDHVYNPFKGQMIELSNEFYGKVFGSEYNFLNITLDARKYIHLWKENVLALQGFVNVNDGNIPFRMMGVIGNDVFMRGYYNGRFRDNHAMAFQAELRKHIWGPIGCVLFAGGGTVAHVQSDLFSGIKPNYGLGLRVKVVRKERLNARIDYGFGANGISALYIGLSEAF